MDLITPKRLIHGRANKRALSGCCTVERPSRMLDKMNEVFEAWWKAWHMERMVDFVAKPNKWLKSDPDLMMGDIVVFQKNGDEQVLGQPVWRVGRIIEVEVDERDQRVRAVTREYKNAEENVFRTTKRAARKLAVLHKVGDLELVEELNEAARLSDQLVRQGSLYLDQQEAVLREVQRCAVCGPPFLCLKLF